MFPTARVLSLLLGWFLIACGSTASGGAPPVAGGGAASSGGAGGGSAPAQAGASGNFAGAGAAGSAGAGGSAVSCPPFTGVSVAAMSMNNLIPLPVSVTPKEGAFALTSQAGIYVEPGTPEMLAIGQYLADKLKPATGYALPVASTSGAPCAGNLYLTTQGADASLGAEGYQLDIDKQSLRLAAAQPAGVFRGLQTLRQLLPASIEASSVQAGPWGIAAGTIRDYPRFAWRGMMLDVARHFFSVADVQKLIDRASYFKINTFHLHLSDDQGFRLAIDSWPNLTQLGASTATGGGPGGFFTKADYAALASYGELTCNGVAPAMRTDTLVGYSSLCVHKDQTYQFVSDVLREVAAITPGAYLHLGGDEAKATTVEDFQFFFVKAQIPLQTVGKRLIGWDALGQLDNLPADSIVQFWISSEFAKRAVELHAKVLMSPANKAYLDMKYDTATPLGQNWAGYITERTAYEWDPATLIQGVGESDVIGVEAPLWTEYFKTLSDLEYMTFPRLPGIAEIGWSKATGRNWDEYKLRIASYAPRLKAWNVNFYKSSAIPWP